MTQKITLWQPILKSSKGNGFVYEAVLSDDSLDRDDEMIGKEALMKTKDSNILIVGLMDHENKIMNQVCEWVNKRIEDRNGHTAFIAEPKFFMSNPNAKIIKGMLDEGANMGISIGAIVNKSEMRKIGDVEKKVFTDIEVVEASFVAVPANSHARITAVAKMFNTEEKKLEDKTYSEKEYTDKVSEIVDLNKKLEAIPVLEKELKESQDALDKAVKEHTTVFEKQIADTDEKVKDLEKEVQKYKDAPVHKATHTQDPALIEADEKKRLEDEKYAEKKTKEGFVPVGRY